MIIKYSPKEQLFVDAIEVLHRQDKAVFAAEEIAMRFYGGGLHPPFWYQATIATMSRVVRKMADDTRQPLKIKKDFGHGRGKKAKYIIERKEKPQQL